MIKNFTMTLVALTLALGLNAQSVAVTNGGFESDYTEAWTMESNGGSEVSFYRLSDLELPASMAQEGENSLVVLASGLGENDWDQQIFNRTWAVEKGKTYRLTIWMKDISPDGGFAVTDTMVASFTAGHATLYHELGRVDHKTLSRDWEQWSLDVTPQYTTGATDYEGYPDEVCASSMSIHFVGLGACMIDDFQVSEVDPAGINDVTYGNLDVYPCPVTDELFINTQSAVEICVTNIAGQRVAQKIGSELTSIDMSGLNSGIYLVNVKDINGKVYLTKVVKN